MNLTNKTELKNQVVRILIFKRLYYKNQERIMLINSLYSKKQLVKEDFKGYLKRISTLIRRDEVRRTRERTTLDYGKLGKKTFEVIWRHEEDSMKLDELNKKKRKCFKYEK